MQLKTLKNGNRLIGCPTQSIFSRNLIFSNGSCINYQAKTPRANRWIGFWSLDEMGLQWGSNGGKWKNNLCMKYIYIIGLRAPGNYSASFWSNKISISLCEGPKPPNSMIAWFWDLLLMAYLAYLWRTYGFFMACSWVLYGFNTLKYLMAFL